jgi:xanthine dehydrogenase large subunit
VIAAETREAAREARRRVRIVVKEEAPVLTIPEARDRNEFIGVPRQIARGDFRRAFAQAPHRHEGVFHVDGQEQFYFESQAAVALPGEGEQLHVYSSTQNPTEGQHVVAHALGLSMHQVVIECKRMGGGFGGKETQAVIPSVAVALVAMKTGRPARVIYTKDDDMKITGKRHQYEAHYQIGYDDDGTILAAKLDFFSNGGAYCDLSPSVLERTMLHAENAYFIPNIEINGRICRTNIPPATAFRGFGGPQGVATIENALQEIAQKLGIDAFDVRRRNCYDGDRNVTPYGQIIRENSVPRVFDELLCISDYRERVAAVEQFNRRSRTHLRGIAMTPVKFGIAFTASFLNQGNALVNVYFDGTVQVSTGATEMGQGVNIKMAQIVADEFGLPLDRVIVRTTTTEKSINTSPTAASASTDLNGFAALDACRQIKQRMAIFAATLFASVDEGIRPSAEHLHFRDGHVFDDRVPGMKFDFADFAKRCRLAQVDLGARGFYKTPGVDFNRDTGRGNPFHYYTTGTAVSEVTIDRFTGDLRVDAVHLLMDIGRPINPGVDRGQVIGGFVQGMGWVTTEKLVYNDKGALLSYSPTTYKIPGVDDVPRHFHVEFLDNDANRTNIYSSKAVGEPPLLLGISTWAAVKHALTFLAEDEIPDLKLPATGEEILRCIQKLKKKEKPRTSSSAEQVAK